MVHFKNGDVFTGTYVDNSKCGAGTYRWASGAEETGEYVNGEKHGWHQWRRAGDEWDLFYDRGTVVIAQKCDQERPPKPADKGSPAPETPSFLGSEMSPALASTHGRASAAAPATPPSSSAPLARPGAPAVGPFTTPPRASRSSVIPPPAVASAQTTAEGDVNSTSKARRCSVTPPRAIPSSRRSSAAVASQGPSNRRGSTVVVSEGVLARQRPQSDARLAGGQRGSAALGARSTVASRGVAVRQRSSVVTASQGPDSTASLWASKGSSF